MWQVRTHQTILSKQASQWNSNKGNNRTNQSQSADANNNNNTSTDSSQPSNNQSNVNAKFRKRFQNDGKKIRIISRKTTSTIAKVCPNESNIMSAQFLLDSGATDHFVYDEKLLSNKEKIVPTEVTGINKSPQATYYSDTIGDVIIRVDDGTEFVFTAHFPVPELDQNYFSLSTFGESEDEFVIINGGKCMLKYEDNTIIVANHVERSYVGEFNVICERPTREEISHLNVSKVAEKHSDMLTHQRYAHAGADRINRTAQYLTGVQTVNTSLLCSDCALNKTQAPSYKDNPFMATQPLQLVHSDLAGPFVQSLEGYSMNILLILYDTD